MPHCVFGIVCKGLIPHHLNLIKAGFMGKQPAALA